MSAFTARAGVLRIEESRIGLGHRILRVVVHQELLFVDEFSTLGAIPPKAIDFTVKATALQDQGERVRRESGRVLGLGGIQLLEPAGMTATLSCPSGVR